jgi:hypothetical protein
LLRGFLWRESSLNFQSPTVQYCVTAIATLPEGRSDRTKHIRHRGVAEAGVISQSGFYRGDRVRTSRGSMEPPSGSMLISAAAPQLKKDLTAKAQRPQSFSIRKSRSPHSSGRIVCNSPIWAVQQNSRPGKTSNVEILA